MATVAAGAPPGAGRLRRRFTGREQTRQQLQPRLPALLVLLACSWLLVIGMTLLDGGHQHGHQHGQPGLGHAGLLTLVLGWQLMALAMMGPSCLPAARHVAMNTLRPARTVPAFLAGYLLLWTGYLALVTLVATAAVTVVRTVPGTEPADLIAAPPAALTAVVLLAAAVWQLTPVKRASLRHCRSGRVLPAAGRRADLGAVRFGARHGLACVGSCGPMMLVMLTLGSGHLVAMAALGGLIWLEKTRWVGRRLAVPSAAAFALLAVTLPVLST